MLRIIKSINKKTPIIKQKNVNYGQSRKYHDMTPIIIGGLGLTCVVGALFSRKMVAPKGSFLARVNVFRDVKKENINISEKTFAWPWHEVYYIICESRNFKKSILELTSDNQPILLNFKYEVMVGDNDDSLKKFSCFAINEIENGKIADVGSIVDTKLRKIVYTTKYHEIKNGDFMKSLSLSVQSELDKIGVKIMNLECDLS